MNLFESDQMLEILRRKSKNSTEAGRGRFVRGLNIFTFLSDTNTYV